MLISVWITHRNWENEGHIVINDAVGAPGEEAYQAALTNYGYIANQVLTTDSYRPTLV